jgi:hypothetical protein
VSLQTSGTSLANDPRILAGAAAGLVSAVASLVAFQGLPMGTVLFWLAPLPLFLAGLGFGLVAFGLALLVASLALLLASPGFGPALVWLGAYGVPAALLLGTGLKPGPQLSLGLPLALLGLWPACVVLLAGMFLAGPDGGLEGELREAVTLGLARMGVDAPAATVEQIVRLKAAALALWLGFVLAANAAFAQRLLARRGLALRPVAVWRHARLPRWYPALPALAVLGWLLADAADTLLPMSLALVLAVPLLLQGLAALHTRLAAVAWRAPALAAVYVLLFVFSLHSAAILVALGLVEQFGRALPPPANS